MNLPVNSLRLFVFDLDGTLVDSRRDLAESANALLEACAAEPLSEARIGRMVGDGAATLVARVFEARGLAPPADALARFLAIYDEQLLHHTRPYAGIPELLDRLAAGAELALLTNKPLEPTRRILAGLDLARHFRDAAVVGGDGPWPRKPDPAALRALMGRAGVGGDETLLVGDSVIDFRTARAAPARICLARYGFGFEEFPVHELGPDDLVIDTPGGLMEM